MMAGRPPPVNPRVRRSLAFVDASGEGKNKVIANVSLVTGDPSVADAFGHGTHVAGIIAGNGAVASGITNLYTGGIAPGARLVNVRVLGANGTAQTSEVIAGINWVIANRSRYNIRVINLSFRQLALRHHRRRIEYLGDRQPRQRYGDYLQLERSNPVRSRCEARRRRARQQNHLARGKRLIPACHLSFPL